MFRGSFLIGNSEKSPFSFIKTLLNKGRYLMTFKTNNFNCINVRLQEGLLKNVVMLKKNETNKTVETVFYYFAVICGRYRVRAREYACTVVRVLSRGGEDPSTTYNVIIIIITTRWKQRRRETQTIKRCLILKQVARAHTDIIYV